MLSRYTLRPVLKSSQSGLYFSPSSLLMLQRYSSSSAFLSKCSFIPYRTFCTQIRGRNRGRTSSKSAALLKKVKEKRTLEEGIQSYEFEIDALQVKQLEAINTAMGVLNFYNQADTANQHPIFKVHVLGRLVRNMVSERINPAKMAQNEKFQQLYNSMKATTDKMDPKALSAFILYSTHFGIKDQDVLEYAKQKVTVGGFRQINPQDFSAFIFAFAKAGYTSEFLQNDIVKKLTAEQPVNMFILNRNMYACRKLGIYDKEMYNKFEKVLKDKQKLLNEPMVVNIMNSFSHFDHMTSETGSILTRHVIENVESYKTSSLASICTFLVRVEKKDTILLDVIKKQLMTRFQNSDPQQLALDLRTSDLAQLQVAFTHFEKFDSEMLTTIEETFLELLEHAKGQESAAMLVHHCDWARDVLKYDFQAINKGYRKKVIKRKNPDLNKIEKTYKKYNDIFFEKMLTDLQTKVEDINVNALIKIQTSLHSAKVKKNSTKRVLFDFFVSGLKVFLAEMGENNQVEPKEYRYLLLRYYNNIKPFLIKKEQLVILIDQIYRVLNINIFDVIDELVPMAVHTCEADQWEEELRKEVVAQNVTETVNFNSSESA